MEPDISTDTLNPSGLAHEHLDNRHSVPPAASRAERTASFELADFPMPSGREEEWRFTPNRRFQQLLDGAASAATLTTETSVPAPARLSTVPREEVVGLGVQAPNDRLAALAVANSATVSKITVPADAELDEPIRLTLDGTGEQTVWSHLLIELGAHAKATVILLNTGSTRYSEVISTVVGDGAQLTLISIQDWADDTVHAGQHDALLGRDASYTYVPVTLGGDAVRLNANVRYNGPGGSAQILGVYFADAGQHLEHRSFIDHNQPHCSSDVVYKGALQGDKARTVWVGDVLIRAEAVGTQTYEINRNLLLTDGARADSVPNLEIETGEIEGAGHAAATGRFDDEQLFYLQARGIPEPIARRLVVRGFFADIIGRIAVPEIRDRLMARIEAELEKTIAPLHGQAEAIEFDFSDTSADTDATADDPA